MPIVRNIHAHEAIRKWLHTVPQDQEFRIRDLHQMALRDGVEVGFTTLIAHLQKALQDGTVSSPSKGIYAIHVKAGQAPLIIAPLAALPSGEVTVHTLQLQLVHIAQVLEEMRSKMGGC
jgi:hypothetical protein